MSEKDKGGRPRIELTEEDYDKLKQMIRIQCTAEEISSVLDMSSDTLDRRLKERGYAGFAECLKKYEGEGKASLRRQQWKSANGGNVTMQIWLGKQNLGQTDKQDTNLGLQNNNPITSLFEAIAANGKRIAED